MIDDKRHKDANWQLPTAASGAIADWDSVKIAVLMDIRDELKKLNTLLHCSNFTSIPFKLDTIAHQTKPSNRCRKRHIAEVEK